MVLTLLCKYRLNCDTHSGSESVNSCVSFSLWMTVRVIRCRYWKHEKGLIWNGIYYRVACSWIMWCELIFGGFVMIGTIWFQATSSCSSAVLQSWCYCRSTVPPSLCWLSSFLCWVGEFADRSPHCVEWHFARSRYVQIEYVSKS